MSSLSTKEKRNSIIFTIFLCVLGCVYYYAFFVDSSSVVLNIEVEQRSVFKLYWSYHDDRFSESRSILKRIDPTETVYEFSAPGLANAHSIRIDPITYEGDVLVKSITILQRGFEPTSVDFTQLRPLNQIEKMTISDEGLAFTSSGKDPFFLYQPDFQKVETIWLQELIVMVVISGGLIIFISSWSSLRENFGYVPLMLSVIFILVLVMAAVSKRNVHPDEYVHLAATDYYERHWLPPEVEDKTIENTYSVYGQSRLNNGEIYYLFAGKVKKFFALFKVPSPLSSRLFNVLLLGLIVSYSVYCIPARAVAIPFIISPQIWYIFSYCNSDAFALFICFIVCCELVRDDSLLSRALTNEKLSRALFAIGFISVLFGMLFLLKKNYYPFIASVYFFLLIKFFLPAARSNRLKTVSRIALISLLAIGFFGARLGLDYYVNGMDRQDKLLVMQEKMAKKLYKPSTDLAEKHPSLYKKSRNIPLKTLIVKDKWFEKTFSTGFGVYGYFTIAGPDTYYELVKWLSLVLLVYLCTMVFIHQPEGGISMLVVVFCLSVALIGVSLNHSWTMDFQAQGRYLFPILCMFGIITGHYRALFHRRLFVLSVSQLYILGLYSFVFIALLNIPRG